MVNLGSVLKRWQALKAQMHPLAERLERDPTYRLRSHQEVALAAELGFRLDVNRATVDDWLRLPGISIRQAQVLTQLRQGGVQFLALEDVAAALGLSIHQLQPLAGVLSFCYYDDHSPLLQCRVNLNEATVAQLAQVPGLSLDMARMVLAERRVRGRFRSISDFQQRLNFSPQAIADLMHYLYC